MTSDHTGASAGRGSGLGRALKAALATLLSGILALAPCTSAVAQAATTSDSDEIVGNLAIVAYTEDTKITDGHSFLVFTSYKDGVDLKFTDLYGYHEKTSEFKAASEKNQDLLTWRAQFDEAAKQVGSDVTLEEYLKTDQYEREGKYPELFKAIYDLGDKNFKSVEGAVQGGDDRYRLTSYDCTLNSGDYISIGLYNLGGSTENTARDAIQNSTLVKELTDIIEKYVTGGHTKDEAIGILADYLKQYLEGEIGNDEIEQKMLDYLKGALLGTGFSAAKLLIESYKDRENLLDGDTRGGLFVNHELWRQKVYQTLAPNEIYSVDITRAQLDRMMAFYNSGSENHYSVMTHNCAAVCTGAWNAAVGTDANGNQTGLYLSALDDSLIFLKGFFYSVRELRNNIIALDKKDDTGKRYEWQVIHGVEVPQTVSMLRLYNPWSGEHLYTASTEEHDNLVELGWQDEGIAWTAPKTSSTPVYRLYNPYSGDHHYTMSEDEYNECAKRGWKQEGVGWYSDDAKGVELYRGFNPYEAVGTHHYTASRTEIDTMVKNGWRDEGIAWYGMK